MKKKFSIILKQELYLTYEIEADDIDEATNIATIEFSSGITMHRVEEPEEFLTVWDSHEITEEVEE